MPHAKIQELEETLIELEELGADAEDAASRMVAAMGEVLDVVTKRSRLAFKAHRLLAEAKAIIAKKAEP